MINIFWSKENDDVFVSNDLKAIADVNENKNLSEYGVQEFILNENTIGSNTMYCGINRLRFGNELILQEDKVSEQKLYDYNPEKIAFDEYLKRIEIYFSNISKFKGNIGVELSAGYDTRLVATCASRHIKSIKGITNENLADFGVDIATAEIIAKELKIPFTKIIRSKDIPLNEELMMHSLAMGRDVIRSKDMLKINKMKYEHSDLILSGYGGEILRGKHCKYKSTDDFADKYYYGNILLNWGFTETNKHIKKVLTEEYHQDWIDSSEKMSNWLYAMDRMRIWGGSSVVGKLICGDNLHPFMDWYLMEPLFSWNFDELKNNALALKIMKRFSQDITNIPFNSVHPIFIKEPLLSQKFISKKLEYLHRILKRIFIKTGLKKENISEKIKEIFNRYPQINITDKLNSISKLSLKKLEQTQKINYFTRFATVQLTLDMID